MIKVIEPASFLYIPHENISNHTIQLINAIEQIPPALLLCDLRCYPVLTDILLKGSRFNIYIGYGTDKTLRPKDKSEPSGVKIYLDTSLQKAVDCAAIVQSEDAKSFGLLPNFVIGNYRYILTEKNFDLQKMSLPFFLSGKMYESLK